MRLWFSINRSQLALNTLPTIYFSHCGNIGRGLIRLHSASSAATKSLLLLFFFITFLTTYFCSSAPQLINSHLTMIHTLSKETLHYLCLTEPHPLQTIRKQREAQIKYKKAKHLTSSTVVDIDRR